MAEDEPAKEKETPPTTGLSAYVQEIQRVRFIPQNEFEHGDSLIRSEYDDDSEVMNNFSKIVDKHLQLVNIGNDQILRLYQTDAVLLTQVFSISLRSPAFTQVAKVMFFGWRNELLLTKAKEGAERKYQASIGTKYATKEPLLGYGASYPSQPEEEEGNILQQLFRRKKRREW